jgi:hypothetical protein
MTVEGYLQQMVEREFSSEPMEGEPSEGSGMVWENGLFVYRTGRPCPQMSLMTRSSAPAMKEPSILWAIFPEALLR